MTDLAQQTIARWDAIRVDAVQTPDGQQWVRADYFNQAMSDVVALAQALNKTDGAKRNAERKARKAKKKIKGSPGDTPVKGVAEQGLIRTAGPNASSDSNKQTTQSQSVSVLPGEANQASNRVALGQTSGSSDIADANGSADVEGRQSLHPTTSRTTA